MAFAPLILMAAATAVSAMGALQQGRAAKKAADYNAAVDKNNAIIARQQAGAQEEMQRRMARRQMGEMVAGYGASGVTTEGSPLDMLAQSARDSELDALNIRYGGELKGMGFEADATRERMAGKAAKTASYYGAASTMLSGASKMASMGK